MIQRIEQAEAEAVRMYMRLPKVKLAEMLYNCNKMLDAMAKHIPITQEETK